MNPIAKALQEIQFVIPRAVLQAAFVEDMFERSPIAVNLESAIRERVIHARVLVDINLAGGMMHHVPLDRVPPEYVDGYMAVFNIPKELTQGRSISRVLALAYGTMRNQINYPSTSYNYNENSTLAQGVVASHTAIPVTETTNVRLLADNIVAVMDLTAVNTRADLRCYLDHDPELSQLRATTVAPFAEMCVLATKAYIHNTMTINIGKDMLVGGRELGRMREIVDSYADANELYQTFLTERWRKISIFNDPMARQRLTRLSTGGWR